MTDMIDTIGSPERTRPQMQQEDLGPIVGYLTGRIYERAATHQPEDMIGLTAYPGMVRFANHVQYVLGLACREELDIIRSEGGMDAFDRLLADNRVTRENFNSSSGRFDLTHYDAPHTVVQEGLYSGVVMPLATYQRAQAELGAKAIEPSHLTMTLRDKYFQNTLLQLANTYNGFYEIGSTSPATLTGDQKSPFGEFENVDPQLRIFTDKGKLSNFAKALLAHARTGAGDSRLMKPTMGCPVRLATFHQLGEYAQAFARDNGLDEAVLLRQDKPAIVLGCEFLATEIEKQVAYSQDATIAQDVGHVYGRRAFR